MSSEEIHHVCCEKVLLLDKKQGFMTSEQTPYYQADFEG
jgi:hypothetical protein